MSIARIFNLFKAFATFHIIAVDTGRFQIRRIKSLTWAVATANDMI